MKLIRIYSFESSSNENMSINSYFGILHSQTLISVEELNSSKYILSIGIINYEKELLSLNFEH